MPVVVATKRYVNKDFLAGATCDPTCNPPHTIKEVHFIDLENKATQDRIKTCSLIDGDSVNTANAGVNGMTPLIGIVNECSSDAYAEQSNTCWFNAFFQSLVWLDPVAECALACLLAEENTVWNDKSLLLKKKKCFNLLFVNHPSLYGMLLGTIQQRDYITSAKLEENIVPTSSLSSRHLGWTNLIIPVWILKTPK